MVWFEYYAALFGDAQFMRRHSLALFWSHQQQKPQPQLGFLPFMERPISEFWILNASRVKFWIFAETTREALRHKAYPISICGRTRSTTPSQILTESNCNPFILNDLRFSRRLMGVIKPP